ETEYPGIRSQTEFGNEWNEWTSGDSQRQSGNADFFPSRWRMHIGEPSRAQGLGQHLRVDRVAVNQAYLRSLTCQRLQQGQQVVVIGMPRETRQLDDFRPLVPLLAMKVDRCPAFEQAPAQRMC